MTFQFLEEKIDEHIDKRLKRTPGAGDAVYLLHFRNHPVGTAFAIDESHVLSARHNMFEEDEPHDPLAIAVISDSSLVFASSSSSSSTTSDIQLRIKSCPDPPLNGKISDENDWIILERTDSGKFRSFLLPQLSTEVQMDSRRPWITIYHFPVAFQRAEKSKYSLVASQNRVISAEKYELKCGDLSLLSKGSCGGPYVDNVSKTALGFHIAGATSYEGTANKRIVEAISNIPIGLQFHPLSPLVVELKRLIILL